MAPEPETMPGTFRIKEELIIPCSIHAFGSIPNVFDENFNLKLTDETSVNEFDNTIRKIDEPIVFISSC